jgi:hypothetical protein
MFRQTLMAVAAAGLLTATGTAPAYSGGVRQVKQTGSSYALSHQPGRRVMGLKSTTGVRSGGCTGAACNGGNAGILFGDGGDGASGGHGGAGGLFFGTGGVGTGNSKFEDMKSKTGMGRKGAPARVRGSGFFQVRNHGG